MFHLQRVFQNLKFEKSWKWKLVAWQTNCYVYNFYIYVYKLIVFNNYRLCS